MSSESQLVPWKGKWRHYRARLVSKIWHNKTFKRAFYNIVSWVLRKDQTFQTLNCGMVVPEGELSLASAYPNEITRYGIQLYHYVCSQSFDTIKGKVVLEIGCGRGGGTFHIAKAFSPQRIRGIDFSRQSIRVCKRNFSERRLTFEVGDALSLNADNGSQDIVLSIETTCCIQDKLAFFRESHRVLKPGGLMLYLDFMYKRETAELAIRKIEQSIEKAGFEVVAMEDLTAPVFRAIQAAARIREETIAAKCPRFLQPLAHGFSMTSKSGAYRGFAEGRTEYRFYQLRKSG